MAFSQSILTDNQVPLLGISEWMCYYANYDKPGGKISDIDECVELHLRRGFDQMVWNLGRSVVDYWSDLPNVTRMCELNDQVGGKSWRFVGEVMEQVCPLRRALELCGRNRMMLWGRLGMNRHYGSESYAGVTSRMALEKPQLRERSKRGNEVAGGLCYALEEVQQERLDILLEAQRIGAQGLVLDFCRQMPMLMYHPALVEPYREKSGVDPREIDGDDPEEYAEWFQYRADVLTGFMKRLRGGVRRQEEELGRECPIIARVPDSAPWLMVAYGLDSERWCRDDLIDGVMLSPFPITVEDTGLYVEHHAETAHRYGKICIGGIGSKRLIESGVEENIGFFHAQPIYALAERQYRAGVDGMSLYQSETLVRMEYLKELIGNLGKPEVVTRMAEELPVPDLPENDDTGMDWHAHGRGRYGLRVEVAGDAAL
ncbi:MAG: hypothetical protein HOC74_05555 [Gemmatimonadetes bacterium]|nr:hypothetical protein [Gemmatimonadota bacterium]